MSISLVIMLGMPILYVTGSLRKSTSVAGISGACFVFYFIICTLLSIFAPIMINKNLGINLSGTFMCLAPVIYLLVRRDFTFHFYLAAMVTVLISVTASFLSISYTISFISALLVLSVSLVSLIFLKHRAPLYAPVLIGIYSVSADIMSLLTQAVRTVYAFDVLDIASVSFVVCLALSYLLSRPWHKTPAMQT